MLSIIACIKQVPDTQGAVFDPSTGTIDRGATGNILNPDDAHALEMALALRDSNGGRVTALTMGPLQAADVLREAYALGVDRCVLASDPRFAGSDSLVTSKILSRAIGRLGAFDVIVTGREAIDGSTGHVAYQLSEYLGVPLVTQIHRIHIEGRVVFIERIYGHEYQKIRVSLPVLLAVSTITNRVRAPRLVDIASCGDREIDVIGMDDIGGRADEYGAAGSPTLVLKTELFSHRRGREVIAGTVTDKVDLLVQRMKKHNILRY